MGNWSRFVNWLFGDTSESYSISGASVLSPDVDANTSNLSIGLGTMNSAINYLAENLSMSEWRVMESGKYVKNDLYYRLNYQPNPNQTKAAFCTKLVRLLSVYNEALIFARPGRDQSLYIADIYNREDCGVNRNKYTNISIDNMTPTVNQKDIIPVFMGWEGLDPMLRILSSQYGKLIDYAVKSYAKQAGEHGVLTIESANYGNSDQAKAEETRVYERFKRYFAADSAVLPLHKGYSYTANATAHRNTSEMNDVINLTDEYAERVGVDLHVPPALLKGNVENLTESMQLLISGGVAPLAESISQALSFGIYGFDGLQSGNCIYIDTTRPLLRDLAVAGKYCKDMMEAGQYNQDELRELRREPLIRSESSQKYLGTLNWGDPWNSNQ